MRALSLSAIGAHVNNTNDISINLSNQSSPAKSIKLKRSRTAQYSQLNPPPVFNDYISEMELNSLYKEPKQQDYQYKVSLISSCIIKNLGTIIVCIKYYEFVIARISKNSGIRKYGKHLLCKFSSLVSHTLSLSAKLLFEQNTFSELSFRCEADTFDGKYHRETFWPDVSQISSSIISSISSNQVLFFLYTRNPHKRGSL